MPLRDSSPHRSDAQQGGSPAVDQVPPPPPPELVQARIRASAILADVLLIRCRQHGADVGQSCWSTLRGACGHRLRLAGYSGQPWHAPSGRPLTTGHWGAQS